MSNTADFTRDGVQMTRPYLPSQSRLISCPLFDLLRQDKLLQPPCTIFNSIMISDGAKIVYDIGLVSN